MHECSGHICHPHNHIRNAKKTLIVIIVTFLAMIFEITYALITNSMALLADGWHMGAHVLVLGLSYAAYVFIKKIHDKPNAKNVAEKVSALAGYTSSIFLLITGILLIIESISRFFTPLEISFDEAVFVAIVSLIINLICVVIMEYKSRDTSDYNFKAVYLHIIADILTSVLAIIALLIGKYFNIYILDPITGIIGAIVILQLSINLIKATINIVLDLNTLKS